VLRGAGAPRAHPQPTHAQLLSRQRSPTPQSHSVVHGVGGVGVPMSVVPRSMGLPVFDSEPDSDSDSADPVDPVLSNATDVLSEDCRLEQAQDSANNPLSRQRGASIPRC
jgi:hypothetical protein